MTITRKAYFFKVFRKVAYTFRGRHLNKFGFVRTTLNFLLRNFKPDSVMVDGNRMFLDKDDSMRLSILGIYEPLAIRNFQESIKSGDIVLDIGAHIGYYTLMAAKRVGEKGKVYAFEPNLDNCILLRKNLKINGFKNVIIVDKAVAQSTKRAKLFLSQISTGMHSLLDIDDNPGFNTLVDTVSLDDFFAENIPRISVIKMDIEGGEYAALGGMKKLLKRNKKLALFTEFSPYAIKKAKKSPQGFLNLLKLHGFKIFSIDESKGILSPLNIKSFVSSCPLDRDWHINLLAVK